MPLDELIELVVADSDLVGYLLDGAKSVIGGEEAIDLIGLDLPSLDARG